MKQIIDLGILGEVEVDVTYDFKKARRGDPPDPAELTIKRVLHGIDLDDALRNHFDTSYVFFLDVCEAEADQAADRADFMREDALAS